MNYNCCMYLECCLLLFVKTVYFVMLSLFLICVLIALVCSVCRFDDPKTVLVWHMFGGHRLSCLELRTIYGYIWPNIVS